MDSRTGRLLLAGAGAGAASVLLLQRLLKYKPPKKWTFVEQGGPWGAVNRPTAGPRKEKALPVGEHPLALYSLGTPNGVKVTILLEELCDLVPSLEYDAFLIKIGAPTLAQFDSGFVALNPNSKIPALLDRSDAARPVRVWESGSILVYLADKYDAAGAFLPKERAARAEVMNWLMWQMGSAPYLGGGFGHFYSYAPHRDRYAIDRFTMETKRQLDVLDRALADGRRFLCGEQFTLADIAIWPWYGALARGLLYGAAEFLDVRSYEHVCAWAERVFERPAVKRGRMVNRTWGAKSEQLHERHARSDFGNRTQDKLEPAT